MSKSATSTAGKIYAGLDVSLKETAVCIVDDTSRVISERMLPTDPQAIAKYLKKHAPGLDRVGLESGATRPGCGASSVSSGCRSCALIAVTRIACCR